MHPTLEALLATLSSALKGAEAASLDLVAAILAGGHVLIEGAPGVGKTTLAKTLARSVQGRFRRIQFTPDLLPSDLLGYSLYRQDRGEFDFIEGPVFTNFLLADEINRTSPRIQSALLECMNERQVSIDGETRPLPGMFHVIATQNNRFAAGTFPLPEPQLDRFLVSIEMVLPDADTQVEMLEYHLTGGNGSESPAPATIEEFQAWKAEVQDLPVSREICRYIVRLCEELRRRHEFDLALSNRATIALSRMAQSIAYLEAHPAVYPEDVKKAFLPVLTHRVLPPGTDGGASHGPGDRNRVRELLHQVLEAVPAG